MLYMTAQKYRSAGFGNDLTNFDDATLTAILARASAAVNAFCSAPTLPQMHDFRGGTITNEQHIWNIGSELIGSQRRVYPWHSPLLTVTAFQINVDTANYITISPDDMYVNLSDGWVEVVAMTLGIGVFPVVANLSMATPVGQISYTYGYQFPVTGERLVDTDGQTFRAQNQFWLADPAPTIYVDGVEQTSGVTVDTEEGIAVFDVNRAVGEVVTADYTYTLPSSIAEATGITASHALGESALTTKGMAGLLEIQVNEVRLRRPTPTALLAREASTALQVPPDAAVHLAPYIFRTVAG